MDLSVATHIDFGPPPAPPPSLPIITVEVPRVLGPRRYAPPPTLRAALQVCLALAAVGQPMVRWSGHPGLVQ